MGMSFIDPGIRDLISAMNKSGIITRYSCDGVHGKYPSVEPYIAFDIIEGELLAKLKTATNKTGWKWDQDVIDGMCIRGHDIDGLTAEVLTWDPRGCHEVTDTYKNKSYTDARRKKIEDYYEKLTSRAS